MNKKRPGLISEGTVYHRLEEPGLAKATFLHRTTARYENPLVY
ncbi:hypothetical protein SAMN03080594_103254 [Arenibacter palladensis]|uniref:Uncharacterized protein n=1 Tax=Arenibacter palladensis TaxID=237373 RepID=A0A1M5AHR7_9FLAO|nr:hypothetical protein SAMN03080594_103254 [Arenibacter palladensis]